MASTTSSTRTRRQSAASRRVAATQPATPATNATPPVVTAPAVLAGVVQPAGTNTNATKPPRYAVVAADGGFVVAQHGKPMAKVFKTEAQAKAAMDLLIEMNPVKVTAKAEAVKANARRDLAHLLVQAYATAFAALPDDSPILTALGKAEAAQDASNWVHHLPICDTGESWDIVGLPVPKRSNWDGSKRK